MKMNLKEILLSGIPSYCTGNKLVIDALISIYKKLGKHLLIECTSNQVNQFGGYTGKKPQDFYNEIIYLAKKRNFELSKLILGGDHLGPLIWKNEPESVAMNYAEDMVRMFVRAGYQKIHLDTSMRLGSDDPAIPLSVEKIAERGLRLYLACKEEAKKEVRSSIAFIIGSEVPVPGGEKSCDTMKITTAKEARQTLEIYKYIFKNSGVTDEQWDSDIAALVVQPGVEFTKDTVLPFNEEKTKDLTQYALQEGFAFEGHSTDYQMPKALKEMAKGQIKILKVGPELTFVLRATLERLEELEKNYYSSSELSRFSEVLHNEMMQNPKYWSLYYDRSDAVAFNYSLLDRSRYYLTSEKVAKSIEILRKNIDNIRDQGFLYRYMPELIKENLDEISSIFEKTIEINIKNIVDKYEQAVK